MKALVQKKTVVERNKWAGTYRFMMTNINGYCSCNVLIYNRSVRYIAAHFIA